MALYRDVKPGDELRIGNTKITVETKSGQRTRLRIDSPFDVEHVKATAATSSDVKPPAGYVSRLTRPDFN